MEGPQQHQPQQPQDEQQNEPQRQHPYDSTEDDISLPLSATEEERSAVSLPLSAGREQGEQYYQQTDNAPPPPPPPPEWKPIPEDKKFTVRALTEGAMMIAIALLLAFIGNYVPVLNYLGQLLFPLPMAILVFRRGLNVGLVATVALFGLSLTFLPPAQAVYMIVQYGALGLFLGYCYRHQKAPFFTLGFATMIAAAGTLLSLLLTTFISGLPVSSIVGEFTEMTTEMLQVMRDSGSLDNQLALSNQTFEQFSAEILGMVQKLLPAALILSAMAMTLICYLVCAKVLRRLRYQIPQLPPFTSWRIDWRYTWGLIFGLFLGWFGRIIKVGWVESLGDNISYIFGAAIFVCGIALILWLLKHTNLNIIFKGLIVILLVQFFSISIYLIILMAVLDALRDLRPWFARRINKSERLRKPKEQEKRKGKQ